MRSVSWRLMLGGSMLLFMAMSLVALVTPTKTYAAQRDAGCYIHLSPGWQSKNCDDFKVVYPSFSPAGDKCYFSWGTAFGPTPPVDIDCVSAPENTDTDIIFPKDNMAGQVAGETNKAQTEFKTGEEAPTGGAGKTCGEGASAVNLSINVGCRGKGNSIIDLAFALIRFLSIGVGIVMVASLVFAGVQYTASAGNPQATAKALGRISSTAMAFVIYLLIFAILNWLIPAGIFQ